MRQDCKQHLQQNIKIHIKLALRDTHLHIPFFHFINSHTYWTLGLEKFLGQNKYHCVYVRKTQIQDLYYLENSSSYFWDKIAEGTDNYVFTLRHSLSNYIGPVFYLSINNRIISCLKGDFTT